MAQGGEVKEEKGKEEGKGEGKVEEGKGRRTRANGEMGKGAESSRRSDQVKQVAASLRTG